MRMAELGWHRSPLPACPCTVCRHIPVPRGSAGDGERVEMAERPLMLSASGEGARAELGDFRARPRLPAALSLRGIALPVPILLPGSAEAGGFVTHCTDALNGLALSAPCQEHNRASCSLLGKAFPEPRAKTELQPA